MIEKIKKMLTDCEKRINNAYYQRNMFDSGYELGYFQALKAVIRVLEREDKENEMVEQSHSSDL